MSAIIQQIEVGPMANFAYLFGCEATRAFVLIDPSGEVAKLLEALRAHDGELVAVVNTHAHADHVAGNAAVLAAHPVPLIAHRDAEYSAGDMMSRQIFGALGGAPSPAPDRRVQHGDRIEVGELALEVVHAPGHTPGDMVLHHPGAAFTGDVLFVGGLGRTDLPGSNPAEMVRTLRDRLATLPDDTVIYPGHAYGPRPTSTIGEEKRSNVFLREAMRG